jgi:hypothetical protein
LLEGVSLKLQSLAHFGPIVAIAGWLAVVRKPRANLPVLLWSPGLATVRASFLIIPFF